MERLVAALAALKRFFGIGTGRDEQHERRQALLSRMKRSAERLVHSVVGLTRPAPRKQREARRLGAGAVDKPRPWRVRVHVYRLVSSRANNIIRSVGVGGVYHTGVEVGGVEYGFGYHDQEHTGVWKQIPRQLPHDFARGRAKHVGVIDMGEAVLSARALQQLLAECMADFAGSSYSVLTRNCNHFTAELCQRLVHRAPPHWINCAAAKGAVISRAVTRASSSIGRATSSVAKLGRVIKAPIRLAKLRVSRHAGLLKGSSPKREVGGRHRWLVGTRTNITAAMTAPKISLTLAAAGSQAQGHGIAGGVRCALGDAEDEAGVAGSSVHGASAVTADVVPRNVPRSERETRL